MKTALGIALMTSALVVYLQQPIVFVQRPTKSDEPSLVTHNPPSSGIIDAAGPTGTIVIAPMEDGALEARWKKPQRNLFPRESPSEHWPGP